MIDLESIPGVVIRQGTNEDIDFITESLIMASKGGTSVFPYERIFGIEEEEFAIICNNILREDVPGSEFYCGSHMLFTYDEVIIAGLSAWVEGKYGYSSNMIKAMLLSRFIGQERWLRGLEVLEKISVIEGKRHPGVIQMESAYKKRSVFNWFLKEIQGKAGDTDQPVNDGLYVDVFKPLLRLVERNVRAENPAVEFLHTHTTAQNTRAIRFLKNSGFRLISSIESDYPDINKYYPDNKMLFFENKIK